MSMHTRCTHCEAVFRVTLLQLQSSSGRVQCGVCHEVFDAFVNLRAAEPTPLAAPTSTPLAAPMSTPTPTPSEQSTLRDIPEPPDISESPGASELSEDSEPLARSDLPAAATSDTAEASAAEPSVAPEDSDATTVVLDGGRLPGAPPSAENAEVEEIHGPGGYSLAPDTIAALEQAANERTFVVEEVQVSSHDGWPTDDESEDAAVQVVGYPGHDAEHPLDTMAPASPAAVVPPSVRPTRWALTLATLTAAVLLAAQAVYQFRTPIATSLPALRPALEGACAMAGCDIPLPRLPERLVIEASDLRVVDPSRPNRVVLATTVRNAAPVAQAFPLLELSLTDARDQVTARKVFDPQEYLDTPPLAGTGIAPDAEFSVRLPLDIGDIEASGYRVYLFHR